MTDKIKELEQVIAQLKIRAFDSQEQANAYLQNIETLKEFIFKIAVALGIDKTPDLTVQLIIDKAIEAIEGSPKHASAEEVVE